MTTYKEKKQGTVYGIILYVAPNSFSNVYTVRKKLALFSKEILSGVVEKVGNRQKTKNK